MQFVYVINFYEKDRYDKLNRLNDLVAHGWRILSQCGAGDRISYVLEKLENYDYDKSHEYESYCEEYSIHDYKK